MTKHESITIQRLNLKLEAYMQRDNEWKRNIEKQLAPLTNDRFDRIVVTRYSTMAFKATAGVIAFFISILVLFNLAKDILKK